MADITRRVAGGPYFTVNVTFDDVTGVISRLDWTVSLGTLTVIIRQNGKSDITRTVTTDGSLNVPVGQGYTMTMTPKGAWAWTGNGSFEMSWSSA